MDTKPLVVKILLTAVVFLAALGIGMCVATANAATDVTLAWDSNSESDMSHYKMYRSDDGGISWIMVGQIPHVGTGEEIFLDVAVPDGSYNWRVTAVDLTGLESGPSNVVGETLESQPPAPPTGLWVKIKQIVAMIINWIINWFA